MNASNSNSNENNLDHDIPNAVGILGRLWTVEPALMNSLGRGRDEAYVKKAMLEAQKLKLITFKSAFYYVYVALYFGLKFPQDAQDPDLASAISDISQDPDARCTQLYKLVIKYNADVLGPKMAYCRQALQNFASDNPREMAGHQDPNAWISDHLMKWWPQKFQDRYAYFMAMKEQCAETSRASGFPDPWDARIFLVFSFFCGFAFFDDPQYAWAQFLIKRNRRLSPEERFFEVAYGAQNFVRLQMFLKQ